METDSNAPTSSGPNTATAPAPANPPQTADETNSSPVHSMSGALPAADVTDSPEDAEDVGGMHTTDSLSR